MSKFILRNVGHTDIVDSFYRLKLVELNLAIWTIEAYCDPPYKFSKIINQDSSIVTNSKFAYIITLSVVIYYRRAFKRIAHEAKFIPYQGNS